MTNLIVAGVFFAIGYGLGLLNTNSKDVDRTSTCMKMGLTMAVVSLCMAAIFF